MEATNITRGDLYRLVRQRMNEHGLVEWSVRIGSAKRTLGSCRHRDRTISVSLPLAQVNTMAEVEDTILHEIAHALCPPQAGHGPEWRRMARSIGAKPEARSSGSVPITPSIMGECPNCYRAVYRHRRSPKAACGYCCRRHNGGRFSSEYLLVWTKLG